MHRWLSRDAASRLIQASHNPSSCVVCQPNYRNSRLSLSLHTTVCLAHPDGSLSALVPVDEDSFKRLFLLQGQLARHMQHTAGLNPRAFRTVQNPRIAKPLSRGVLDGALLGAFAELSLSKQSEITRQIGTERGNVVRDLSAFSGAF